MKHTIRVLMFALCLGAFAGGVHGVEATLLYDVSISTAPHGKPGRAAAQTLILSETSIVFLFFDVAGSLPSTVTAENIGKATLKIWLSQTFGNREGACVVKPVVGDNGWSESNISNEFLPQLGSSVASASAFVAKRYLTFDLTELVKSWMSGQRNAGLAIVGVNLVGLPPIPPLRAWVDSKENTATSHGPSLEITLKGY